MTIKSGQRYKSAVCNAEFIVIRAASDTGQIYCGGAPLVDATASSSSAAGTVESGPGSVMGKRYEDEGGTLELLCTKTGVGTLSIEGKHLRLKAAKGLPSSD